MFVGEGGVVELAAELPPVGEVAVHQGGEAVVVVALQEVHQLVDDDVFEAVLGLFGQLQVEPEASSEPEPAVGS